MFLEEFNFATSWSDYLGKSEYPKNKKVSKTEKRILDLNTYARALRDEVAEKFLSLHFSRAADKTDEYSFSHPNANRVFIGNVKNRPCFYEQKLFDGKLGDVAIASDGEVKALVNQVESAVRFLAKQYLVMNGVVKGPFSINGIQICSITQQDAWLKYDSTPTQRLLSVAVKDNLVGAAYKTHSDLQIEYLWNRGMHFVGASSDFSVSEKFIVKTLRRAAEYVISKKNPELIGWKFLNPIGVFRTNLRSLGVERQDKLVEKLASVSKKIKGLVEKAGVAKAAKVKLKDNMQLFEQADQAKVVDASYFSEKDFGLFRSLSIGQIDELIDNMQQSSQSRSLANDFETASVKKAVNLINDFSLDVDLDIAGFIAIGNTHSIKIDASLFTDRGIMEDFIKVDMPQISPEQVSMIRGKTEYKVKAKVRGIISVFTVDIIDVNAEIGSNLGSFTLKKALAKFKFDDTFELEEIEE